MWVGRAELSFFHTYLEMQPLARCSLLWFFQQDPLLLQINQHSFRMITSENWEGRLITWYLMWNVLVTHKYFGLATHFEVACRSFEMQRNDSLTNMCVTVWLTEDVCICSSANIVMGRHFYVLSLKEAVWKHKTTKRINGCWVTSLFHDFQKLWSSSSNVKVEIFPLKFSCLVWQCVLIPSAAVWRLQQRGGSLLSPWWTPGAFCSYVFQLLHQ